MRASRRITHGVLVCWLCRLRWSRWLCWLCRSRLVLWEVASGKRGVMSGSLSLAPARTSLHNECPIPPKMTFVTRTVDPQCPIPPNRSCVVRRSMLKCPFLQKMTFVTRTVGLGCPFLPNLTYVGLLGYPQCPILQKRTHGVGKRVLGCPILPNRTLGAMWICMWMTRRAVDNCLPSVHNPRFSWRSG